MTTFTPLSALLAARVPGTGSVAFNVPGDWLQGRTSFGGLISVLAVQAMRDVAGAAWPADVKLRALQTSFIGPVAEGAVQIVVNVLREGKNVRQIQALVQQNDQTAALLLGVFGSERDTIVPVLAPQRPAVARSPEQTPVSTLPPGIAPNFIQHMDTRWAEGAAPYTGSVGADSQLSRLHLRLQGEPADARIDLELLTVLLADVPPSPVLSLFTRPTPASSVSWELELRPLAHPPEADGWWRIDTEVLAAAGGYVNQVSRLWAPSGELTALGYQVVTVYG